MCYKNVFGEFFINNSISVCYDKTNYYLSGGKGKYSEEIIFSDFSNKDIQNNLCRIKYKNIYY